MQLKKVQGLKIKQLGLEMNVKSLFMSIKVKFIEYKNTLGKG